jgi:hypothetical protein
MKTIILEISVRVGLIALCSLVIALGVSIFELK